MGEMIEGNEAPADAGNTHPTPCRQQPKKKSFCGFFVLGKVGSMRV